MDGIEQIERLAVGAVADGVDAELEAMLERQTRRRLDRLDRGGVEPGAARQVGAGCLTPEKDPALAPDLPPRPARRGVKSSRSVA